MRDINLKGYLPDVIKNIKELQSIMESENIEIIDVLGNIEMIANNTFIDYMDEYGCSRWESILEIMPKASDSIDTRRLKIKSTLLGETPYTFNKVKQMLINICGKDNVSLHYGDEEYTLKVGLGLNVKEQYDYICKLLKEIIPANIYLDIWILYNTHEMIRDKPLTHQNINKMKLTYKGLREARLYA